MHFLKFVYEDIGVVLLYIMCFLTSVLRGGLKLHTNIYGLVTLAN